MTALIVLLSGCADHILTASLQKDSARPAGGAAEIAVEPESIAFGGVLVGETATGTVDVRNLGDATMSLVEPQIDGDAAFSTGAFTSTAVLPGEMASFTVTFSPVVSGEVAGTVGILSNDPDAGLVEVALSGSGGVE